MPGRIVLYGATGYTGGLTAQAMLASGARPVLAGRDPRRLEALAARLSQASSTAALETAVAGTDGPLALRKLIDAGDVLVSTAGPFLKIGRAAVDAAVDAGAVYLDSSGEPPFIRQVFEEHGPRAERTGAVLLTAFGYDYVPGNLAGALALDAARSAGTARPAGPAGPVGPSAPAGPARPAATRVDIGYFVRGDTRRAASAGTLASAAGVLLETGYTFRGGRIVSERAASRIMSFEVAGKLREAFSIGSSEHFALPRLPARARLTDVGVYLGWFGGATRLVHYASALAAPLGRVPAVRRVLDAQAARIQRGRAEPDPAARVTSDVVAVAADASGKQLAAVHLTGGDPYSFTAGILAWAAGQAAREGLRPAGALGPVEAFGASALETACAAAGIYREQSKSGWNQF